MTALLLAGAVSATHYPDESTLREQLVSALTNRRARIQLLTGPLGCASSALLASVATALREKGYRVLPVAAVVGLEQLPYGALGPSLAAIAPDAPGPEQALHRLYAEAAPARSRIVLVIDNIPLLDRASAGVVAQLVRIYGLTAIAAAHTRRSLPDALADLAAEGLVDEIPLGLTVSDDDFEERLGPTVVRAVESLTPPCRTFIQILATLGPLPLECTTTAIIDQLEDAGLVVRSRDGTVRLPHEGAARVVRKHFAIREHSPEDLAELVRDISPSPTVRAQTAQLVGYYYAVELRRPDIAAQFGEHVTAGGDHLEHALGEPLETWRSMIGVLAAESAPHPPDPIQAVIRGHQRVVVSMMRAEIANGLNAVEETRRLVEVVGPTAPSGTVIPDVGEYVLTALAGRASELAGLESAARVDGRLPPLWETAIAYFRLRSSSDLSDTRILARSAFTRLEWHEFFGSRAIAAGIWATAAARLGLPREARHVLGQLNRETRPWSLVELQAAEAEAWLLIADGDPVRAGEVLKAALDRAADTGCWGFGTVAATTGIQLGCASSTLNFLRTAATESPESIAPLALEFATATLSRDENSRVTAETRLREAGFLPAAATHASGGLSPREYEIASAAASGETSRSIAERLGLSHRTVETHLQNAYRKLGVTSRRQLAEVFEPR